MAETLGVIGTIAMGIALVLLYSLYRREQRLRRERAKYARDDLAGAIILFQSMRDLLEEQKNLARQLNDSLEKKTAVINKTVGQALDRQAELARAVHKLAVDLENARTELTSIQRQTSYLGGVEGETPFTGVAASVSGPSRANATGAATEMRELSEIVQIFDESEDRSEEDDECEPWVGLDFGGDEPMPTGRFKVPDEVPIKPEDPETAREAFRALLNMDVEQSSTNPSGERAPSSARPGPSGNGRDRITPLQARVYEYNDAGMSVAQIARELGIGKGEIRLMLSLRKDRT